MIFGISVAFSRWEKNVMDNFFVLVASSVFNSLTIKKLINSKSKHLYHGAPSHNKLRQAGHIDFFNAARIFPRQLIDLVAKTLGPRIQLKKLLLEFEKA